jgi:hypothetical protein
MTKIPSIEKTDDFIYRFEIRIGTLLHDPADPHLLAVEQYTDPASAFHSIDVSVSRDKRRAVDVEFRGFEHCRGVNMTCVKFKFLDHAHHVSNHDYLLTVILRYLQHV